MSSADVARTGSLARGPFRSDIECLRGIAVALVVAFHVGLPGFRGGFVGVDVFFVISGYLITRILWREAAASGTISLPNFYARRIRRLIPAAGVMLLATTIVASLLVPPLEIPGVAASIRSAALYVSNEHFRLRSSDYFSGAVRSDPVLHTWSLSVEEQFYLVWPCLILLLWRLTSLTSSRMRYMRWAFAMVAVASFSATWMLGESSRTAVFFGAPFRAWEFAVGAFASTVDLSASHRLSRSPYLRLSVYLAGLGAVAFATIRFSSATQFPGPASLIPVLGTAALLICGAVHDESRISSAAALVSRPLVWLGGRSYGWYLWHWPLLVFAAGASARDTLAVRLTAVSFALLAAALSYTYIETPIRAMDWRVASRRRTLFAGVSAGLLVVCGTFALGQWGRHALRDPVRERYAAAASDLPRLYADGCVNGELDSRVHVCAYGPENGTPVGLYGDSHAVQWYPALEKIAFARGWRLFIAAKTQCPTALIPAYLSFPPRRFDACERWRIDAADSIAARRPRFVLISNASAYVKDPFRTGTAPIVAADVWRDGLIPVLARFDTLGVRPILLRDTPRLRTDVPACLSRSGFIGRHAERCGEPRNIAINQDLIAAEEAAIRAVPRTGLIDMTDVVCPGAVCMPIVRGLVGYSDVDHLTATLVGAITMPLDSAIAQETRNWATMMTVHQN